MTDRLQPERRFDWANTRVDGHPVRFLDSGRAGHHHSGHRLRRLVDHPNRITAASSGSRRDGRHAARSRSRPCHRLLPGIRPRSSNLTMPHLTPSVIYRAAGTLVSGFDTFLPQRRRLVTLGWDARLPVMFLVAFVGCGLHGQPELV